MKKGVVLLVIAVLVLTTTIDAGTPVFLNELPNSSDSTLNLPKPSDSILISSTTSNGNDIDSLMEYSRVIQGLDFTLMNSFSDTSSHLETVDFSSYHIAGWSLHEVQFSISRIVAQSECEVVGSSSNPSNLEFNINETYEGSNYYYNQLAQGFYNIGHDGKLENISLLYDSDYYDPSNQNYAYFDIRSDYQDGST
ncbi:MAG: hypothetical protein ACFFEE_02950, partial [Candidatus Thorarchaeota archaeon]